MSSDRNLVSTISKIKYELNWYKRAYALDKNSHAKEVMQLNDEIDELKSQLQQERFKNEYLITMCRNSNASNKLKRIHKITSELIEKIED